MKKLKEGFVSFQIDHVLRVGKVDSRYTLCSMMSLFMIFYFNLGHHNISLSLSEVSKKNVCKVLH